MRCRLFYLFTVLLVAVVSALPAQKKPRIKPCVPLARTWDAAVEEARLLNVPLVVHSHGFYCGPCWSMHGAVLENKKYIKFAENYCVDVVTVSQLQKGMDSSDPKAATYQAPGPDGQKTEYLLHWPNLTPAELVALSSSKAASFNNTGKVPYTCVVDPYTLQEITHWLGGTSSGSIMDEVKKARKQLVKAHGKGVRRSTIKALEKAEAEIPALITAGDFGKAIGLLEKVAGSGEPPAPLKARLDAGRDRIVKAAEARLSALETRLTEEPTAARKELVKLLRQLRGTGLEARARALLSSKTGN